MTVEDSIEFLRLHQPLPPTEELSQELLDAFVAARDLLEKVPHPLAPKLILGALGHGDGCGTYQTVENVLWINPDAIVIPALVEALASDAGSSRLFAASFSSSYPDAGISRALINVLDLADEDSRGMIALALAHQARNNSKEIREQVVAALTARLEIETDLSVRNELNFALKESSEEG